MPFYLTLTVSRPTSVQPVRGPRSQVLNPCQSSYFGHHLHFVHPILKTNLPRIPTLSTRVPSPVDRQTEDGVKYVEPITLVDYRPVHTRRWSLSLTGGVHDHDYYRPRIRLRPRRSPTTVEILDESVVSARSGLVFGTCPPP